MDVADQMLEHIQHKLVDFKASVLSECDALKLFDEIFHVEVVWDEESLHCFDLHGGYLQQVTQFGEYLVDRNSKQKAKAAMEDHIIIDRDNPFILVLCMDPVDVMPTNFGVHEELTPPILTYDSLCSNKPLVKHIWMMRRTS